MHSSIYTTPTYTQRIYPALPPTVVRAVNDDCVRVHRLALQQINHLAWRNKEDEEVRGEYGCSVYGCSVYGCSVYVCSVYGCSVYASSVCEVCSVYVRSVCEVCSVYAQCMYLSGDAHL
jgi:hypothetical protein